jgi:hypothetical protein
LFILILEGHIGLLHGLFLNAMEYNKISSHRLMRWTPLMTWLLVAFMYEAGP